MHAKDRVWRLIKGFFAWYILNVAWNLYSLAHADPTQLLNIPEVLKALVLPWPLSNPQTPLWIEILFLLAIIVVFLWVSNRLPKLIVLFKSMGGARLLRSRPARQKSSRSLTKASVANKYSLQPAKHRKTFNTIPVVLSLSVLWGGTALSWLFAFSQCGWSFPAPPPFLVWYIVGSLVFWTILGLFMYMYDDGIIEAADGYHRIIDAIQFTCCFVFLGFFPGYIPAVFFLPVGQSLHLLPYVYSC